MWLDADLLDDALDEEAAGSFFFLADLLTSDACSPVTLRYCCSSSSYLTYHISKRNLTTITQQAKCTHTCHKPHHDAYNIIQ